MSDLDKLDIRTVHRHIAKGTLTREAYEAHLAALPDLAQEAELVDYETEFKEEQAEAAPAAASPAPAPSLGEDPVAPPPILTEPDPGSQIR